MSQPCATAGLLPDHSSLFRHLAVVGVSPLTACACSRGVALSEACPACCSVELRTQEAERGMNSEEAEKLVWAAQTIFATGCKLRILTFSLPCVRLRCSKAALMTSQHV